MRYKCVSEFDVEEYVDDFHTGNFFSITEGSIWCENDVNLIGGEVHLECESGCEGVGWIEITRADLEECFEVIN